ncbi:MAG: TIGR01621 family pseudouridine synthase [Paludibacterium sp.]|uniref:TIGR01621 family pseudouridine synthase n=1 Tax=Paludibacterium sp. TaxID=1917523 RepID=UPI0025D1D6FF|nr:TIGR01621 family pseudouridine synthase [Paludibacterium sp.]MBV8045731.1 TIGR01621 family pseudouridine synthase [Paludibacterium sp.]MBV8648951.1 TIGR01621 family pseudouridine synthase [Paludibacterium sp.]
MPGSERAFRLVHQDPRFFVIDKCPGVSFHRQDEEPGLIELARAELGDMWPVHRLDRMTSGLMLLARSPDMARQLSTALAERRIDKRYLALSDRKPAKKQGWVRGDMEKGRGGSWRLLASRDNPAVTHFHSVSLAPGLRVFFLKPLTGRTHQLRVALKSLGAPIIGDERYHPAGGEPADRGYLHAWQLRFQLEDEPFAFQCVPQEGTLFLRADFRALIDAPAWRPDAW